MRAILPSTDPGSRTHLPNLRQCSTLSPRWPSTRAHCCPADGPHNGASEHAVGLRQQLGASGGGPEHATGKPFGLVPGEGFEPPTFGLQNRCTTTVLTRQVIDSTYLYTRARTEARAPRLAMFHSCSGHQAWSSHSALAQRPEQCRPCTTIERRVHHCCAGCHSHQASVLVSCRAR
jgi:hypothetical protein